MDERQRQLALRIDEKLEQRGLNPRQASMLATGKPDLIRDLRRAKGVPRGDRLQALADVLETTVEWLLHGPGEVADRAEAARAKVKTEVAGAGLVGLADVRRAYRGEKPLAPLPLLGSAMGGEFGDLEEHIELTELHLGEVLDYLVRPAALANDKDAYALTILSDSMAPRYKPGETVAVTPREPVSIGDDVIVQLRRTDEEDERIRMVLIKELVRRTPAYVELRQYNPDATFRIPAAQVAVIHKVKGRLL